jgi:hypothetical protein
LASVPVRPARAAWVVERRGSAFVVATDPFGYAPAFSVTTADGVTTTLPTREGALRLARPCGRVHIRASVIAGPGAALVVDEAVVHRASFGGAALGSGGQGPQSGM